MAKILLVEDDHLQAEGIRSRLSSEIDGLEFTTISTESEFWSRFYEIAGSGFGLAIVDVMLRWADPGPNILEPPDDVKQGGFFRAGIRCKDLLKRGNETSNLPVILFTYLDRNQLSETDVEGATLITKSGDTKPLVTEVKSLLHD